MRHKATLLLWALAMVVGLYASFLHRQWLQDLMASVRSASPFWRYGAYLALGCIRGFTLVPATYLLLAGMLILPPAPLYVLTVVGIIVSSTAVYYFADAMGFAEFFERRHASQVARLRSLMQRRELPIVIIWSFLPIAPTDLVCYVCGALRVDLKKCLLGVVIGEGAICAIYVFLGAQALSWVR